MKRNLYCVKKCVSLLFGIFCLNLKAQIITTIAGTGETGYSGDSSAAVSAQLNFPYAITSDATGNLYFTEWFNHCVRKIDQNGIITTIAGTGSAGYDGDGGPAVLAQLNLPTGLAVDAAGNIYISDYGNRRLRKIDSSGSISTIAGTGVSGFSGDGGPAILAQFSSNINLALDLSGNIFIADMNNDRIRKIDANGIISTVAGNGTPGHSGDGGKAVDAQLRAPQGVATDNAGNLFIADSYNHRIRKVNTNGIITTIAGTGIYGYSGDYDPATEAQFFLPSDINVDTLGNLYIVDEINCCIRKINTNNIIRTIAGTGSWGISEDGELAVNTTFYYPKGMEFRNGTLYICDSQSHRIRKFTEDLLAGVDEFEISKHGLYIFPNPATTEIHIDLPDTKAYNVEIYNTLGVTVLRNKNHTGEINVSTLSHGLYYCKVRTAQHEYAGRFLKEE